MEAISCRKTIQEIAADHSIHPIQVSQWKRQLLEGASEVFTKGKNTKDKEDAQAKEAELFQQIGRLQMELEWFKKSLSCARREGDETSQIAVNSGEVPIFLHAPT